MVSDDPESFADLDGHDGWDFAFGVVNAFVSDFTGNGRKEASGPDINSGQALGDSIAVTVGIAGAVLGAVADATVDVGSGGTAVLVSAPAQVAVVALPAMGAIRGATNLLKNSNKESSGGTPRTEHGQERANEAKAGDTHRQVGDANRTIKEGRQFTDSETGNTVNVRGNKAVITDSKGNIVSQFKNSKANTQARIKSGRWVPQK